jgi:Zn-dependent oligopeptidase
MTLTPKQQEILTILRQDDLNLQKIYTEDYLKEALNLLHYLLDEEKEEFAEKCALEDEAVTFDMLYTYSMLDFYFQLLQHRKSTMSDEMISKIIEDFEPHYVAFGNEIAYAKRYYLMLKLALDKNVDQQQKRLLEKAIEQYDIRGIGLS